MHRRLPLLLTVLLAAAAVAGCLGGSDSPEAGTSSTPSQQDAPDDGGDAGGNDTATAETNASSVEVRKDEVTGEITGAGANGCALNLSPISDQPAVFTVPNGSVKLQVNLTLDGTGEVCANFFPPSEEACAGEAAGEATTSDQKASWSTADPAAGEWSVCLYGAGTGPVDGTYVLGLAHHVEVTGASSGT